MDPYGRMGPGPRALGPVVESTPARAAVQSGRQIAGRDYDHQDHCQVCWDGGSLVCCDGCPAAFHPACLGWTKKDVKNLAGAMRWFCPMHSCETCGRKAAAVGGLLFRCSR